MVGMRILRKWPRMCRAQREALVSNYRQAGELVGWTIFRSPQWTDGWKARTSLLVADTILMKEMA
jgi:hypothetical protein